MSIACQKNYSIEVLGQDCPDWLFLPTWAGTPGNPPPENYYSDGVLTRTFFGGQFQLSVNQAFGNSYYLDAIGTMPYAGNGCNCQVSVTMNRPPGYESAIAGFQILQDAVILADIKWSDHPAGIGVVFVVPFSLAASAGSTITVRGQPFMGAGVYTNVSGSPPYPIQYQVAISNV